MEHNSSHHHSSHKKPTSRTRPVHSSSSGSHSHHSSKKSSTSQIKRQPIDRGIANTTVYVVEETIEVNDETVSEQPAKLTDLRIGNTVLVKLDGSSVKGVVVSINPADKTVKVKVVMFGRETTADVGIANIYIIK